MTELMLETLRRAPRLSENYLRRAAAKAESNAVLAAALVARRDLPDDVLTAIKRTATVEVKASYLARNDLSAEALMQELRDEKRTGVLVALLANPQTSPEALRMVEAVFREKPTVGLGHALLSREVETSTAVSLVRFFDPRLSRLGTVRLGNLLTLVDQVARDDEAATEVAEVVTRHELAVLVLANPHLSASTEARALKVASEAGRAHTIGYTGRRIDLSEVLVRSCLRHRGALEFKELFREFLLDRSFCFRALVEEMALDAGLRLMVDPASGRKYQPPVLDRLLCEDDDPDLVTEQIAEIGSESRAVAELHDRSVRLRRLLRARALTAEQAVELLRSLMPPRDPADLTDSYGLELVRRVADRFSDPRVTAAAITAVPSVALAEDWAGRHEDREEVLEEAGSLLLTRYGDIVAKRGLDSVAANSYPQRMLPLLMDPAYPAELSVRFLPWRFFLEARSLRHTNPGGQVHQLVADRTSERLGDDPGAWETFEVLALSHEGTVGELLDITESLR